MDIKELIADSIDVLHAIEAALAANDPYNNLEYSPDNVVTLEDCEIPDHIEDPFRLLRVVLGDERADALEHTCDLELIAHVLDECIKQEGKAQGAESSHGQKVEGQEDRVHSAIGV